MIETYKTEGMFPSTLPGHYFEGPIKAHYRPRRLWSDFTSYTIFIYAL